MYYHDLRRAVQTAHQFVFGAKAVIGTADRRFEAAKYSAYAYIGVTDLNFYEDPNVKEIVSQESPRVDYFIIFRNALEAELHERLSEKQPQRSAQTIIWSMCTKMIWTRVRILCSKANPGTSVLDLVLNPDEIAACLPEGHLPPAEFAGFDLVEAITAIFNFQVSGYMTEFNMSQQELLRGKADVQAEASVISIFGVVCTEEMAWLTFLKACTDRALNKRAYQAVST